MEWKLIICKDFSLHFYYTKNFLFLQKKVINKSGRRAIITIERGNNNMIYCGYQGVGKSTYYREHVETTIDLDSSSFSKTKGWEEIYIRKAQALSEAGFKVFISAHKEVINYLTDNAIQFTLLLPADSKEVWRKRLEYRYAKLPTQGNMNAILNFEKNYDKDMRFYENLNCIKKFIHTKVVTDLAKQIEED